MLFNQTTNLICIIAYNISAMTVYVNIEILEVDAELGRLSTCIF